MKKLLFVLLAVVMSCVCVLGITAQDKPEEERVVFDSPEKMEEYLEGNLERFADEYRMIFPDASEQFDPEYVENVFPLQLCGSDEYVICMDLDGDNGYMIVSADSVLKISVSGELDYLYEHDGEIYFSPEDDDFAYFADGEHHTFAEGMCD